MDVLKVLGANPLPATDHLASVLTSLQTERKTCAVIAAMAPLRHHKLPGTLISPPSPSQARVKPCGFNQAQPTLHLQNVEASEVSWSYDDSTGMCYGITDSEFTQLEAEYLCRTLLKGELTTVTSATVERFILHQYSMRSHHSDHSEEHGLWIAGMCRYRSD